MKLSAGFVLWMAIPSPIAAARTRNLEAHSVVATAVEPRRLTTVEKYIVSGYGMSVSAYWWGTGTTTCEYESNFYLDASNGVRKIQSNGKPSSSPDVSATAFSEEWYDCDEAAALHTYTYFDFYGDPAARALSVSTRLDSASYRIETTAFVVTEACLHICGADEENDWCYYGNCTTAFEGYRPTTLRVRLAATSPATAYRTISHYSGYASRGHGTSSGRERPAAATELVATFETEDGDTFMVVPPGATVYGYIRQTSSGDIYKSP